MLPGIAPVIAGAGQSPLLDGLVAFYAMNGNANDELGSNNGTATNVSWVSGLIGDAGDFNGSNAQISIPVFSSLTTNLTVSCWLRPDSVSGTRTFFRNGTQSNHLAFYMNGSTLFAVKDNIADYSLGGTMTTGAWQHVVYVKSTDSGTNLRAYRNNTQTGTASIGSINAPSGTAYLGSRNGFQYFDGLMDMVGFWNRALSTDEIALLYNGGAGRSYPF